MPSHIVTLALGRTV